MGNPRKRRPVPEYLAERAAKIFHKTEFNSNDQGCKLWPKSTDTGGYGLICLRDQDRKNCHFLTHRLAWELANGPIPEGKWVCHKCDVRRCCNPEHMFLGTERENFADMYRKKRNPRGETHPWAKLTKETVAEIRWYLANTKLSQPAIANVFRGIAPGTIGSIKRGQIWKDVEPKAPYSHAADKLTDGEKG